MTYGAGSYTLPGRLCARCGTSITGELSIPNRKEPDYQKEYYECLQCGYEYLRQEKQLTREELEKDKRPLDFVPTAAQCPICKAKMNFRSDKWEISSHKNSWGYELEYICFECGFWLTEGVHGFSPKETNRRRIYKKLSPLPGLENHHEVMTSSRKLHFK